MKRITPGTVSMAVLAILFGLVAAYTIRRYLSDVGPQGVEVVVAKVNLPRYARLQESNLEVVRRPAEKVPETAIRSLGGAALRLVETTISAGQIVQEGQLYPVDREPILSDQIPAGLRAVTITVNEDAALAGVLLPESLVDVALTANGNHPDFPGAVTVTLVRGVKVLATSQQRHRFSENSKRPLRTITLAATPEQSNKLILAQQYGQLSITLRSGHDLEQVSTVGSGGNLVSPRDLLGLPAARRPAQAKAQIWRGTTMTEINFQPEVIDEAQQATIAAENTRPLVPTSLVPTRRPD
ncbi:MAG: Flp pilus assembly protein CpaB [Planctomycetia bacterium]|nr:Flp pilus assembly protein CpaB [Planctomycetia bacterium]